MPRHMTRTAAAATLACFATVHGVSAQDADLQTRVEEAHQAYESAIADADFEALAAMFSDEAVYQPLTGGMIQGRDAIRQYFQEMGFTEMEVTSTHVEPVGGEMVLDYGTFVATLPEAMGGSTMEGEYIALAELDDTVSIQSLSGFPMREGVPAPN